MNYYSHNIGDYAQATMHLTLVEDAIYSRLLRRYYAEEQPIKNDMAQVCRWVGARSEEEKEAVEAVLVEFFTLDDGVWSNKRADAEIALYRDKSDKAAYAANKRWGKPSNADAMQTHSERIPDAILTNNQEPRTNITTLSSKPDLIPPGKPKEVLDHLNQKTGRAYRPVDTNLKMIGARLQDGVSVDDCKAVIDSKVSQWVDDDKMREFLRPATLFNRTNFEQYLGQLGGPGEKSGVDDVFAGAI